MLHWSSDEDPFLPFARDQGKAGHSLSLWLCCPAQNLFSNRVSTNPRTDRTFTLMAITDSQGKPVIIEDSEDFGRQQYCTSDLLALKLGNTRNSLEN
jgi:hypothetical protein